MSLIASLLYVNLAIAQQYGKTSFYSLVEHFAILLYVSCSYMVTVWTLRRFHTDELLLEIKQYVQILLLSGVLNSLINLMIWVGMRFIAALVSPHVSELNYEMLLANLLFTFFNLHLVVAGIYLAWFYLRQAKLANERKATAEIAASKAQLKNLQRQISPHFLFNNLNVLSSLMQYDPQQAEQYVEKFARVYRYLIRIPDEELVTLEDEFAFTMDYFDLIRIRFSDKYQLDVRPHQLDLQQILIPPGVLQTLVENAVKHNNASKLQPLQIQIFFSPTEITVFNKRQAKYEAVASTQTGLKNLIERYQMFKRNDVKISSSELFFSVTVPVLEPLC